MIIECYQLLKEIEKRPAMWTGEVNLKSIKLFVSGYYQALIDNKIPIIGVAKTNFAAIEKHKRALLRGDSKKPLYITAIGIELDDAFEKVASMAGEFRFPTLLKELDRLTKEL